MKTIFKYAAILLLFSSSVAKPLRAQGGAGSSEKSADCLGGEVKDVQSAYSRGDKDAIVTAITSTLTPYICYAASEANRAKMLSSYEQNRQDKQSGATSGSPGTTTLVSKGSSPWLLGFALEHGGLTQTTDGNTLTFRGNAANSIRALLNSTYLGSYQVAQDDPVVQFLSRLSFGVSFDTQADQPSTTQGFTPAKNNFSGFSAKFEIYNHRDPRYGEWRRRWDQLANQQGKDLVDSIGDLNTAIKTKRKDAFALWKQVVADEVSALPATGASLEDLTKIVADSADIFLKSFSKAPEIESALSRATSRISNYLDQENKIIGDIQKTPIVTLEYNLMRQLTTNDKNITATQPNQKIPDLSNLNLVLERGFATRKAPEITFNAGGTWFNSPNTADPKRGRVRDVRASLEADWQITGFSSSVKPTLSVSGQYLNLFAEPLGQTVTVNGVTIDRRGPIEVFQAKLSIPLAGSGIKIPISFTYASRTELVKESDKRGNIGITFDLDSLFSKK